MESKAEQYYPTYTSKERDILLIEFEEAQKISNGQSKVYGQVTNILLGVATITFTFFLDNDNSKKAIMKNIVLSNTILFAIILFLFGGILLRYFVDLQKQITVNARKVVTLRTLLGLDYGSIQLTLPSWTVEGATNPFAIKYFYGWWNFKSMPFWLLTITINAIWWLATENRTQVVLNFRNESYNFPWEIGYFIIIISYIYIFRVFLYDRHENTFLKISCFICWFLRIRLLENFEYILYRAKLAYLELDRLNLNYNELRKILINIEEEQFHLSPSGFSIKALCRGLLSRFLYFRKKFGLIPSGGSTITMQLSRTLFIPSNQNKYLRKIGEILLSTWLNNQFTKDEILKIYIASVRYDKGTYGLANASKHFFNKLKDDKLSRSESFFLVERLSNINSTVNWNRIKFLNKKIIPKISIEELQSVYNNQIKKKNLIEDFNLKQL